MRKALIALATLLFSVPVISQTPPLGHVIVVAFENHSYSQVVGSSAMPYLNGLISQYALATGYYANTHPSIGNYFELTTGQIISNNDGYDTTVMVDNLERELLKSGKTWMSYAQSIPSIGYLGWDQYPYIKHHNPFAFFSDNVGSSQANHIVPFSQFATDMNNGALPNFSFIAPDQHHNAHDCPVGMSTCTDADMLNAADQFLQYNVAPVLNSAQFQKDGLLVIWWDEGAATDTAYGGGHVAITLVGPVVKRGYRSSTFYQHQNLLHTIASALGVTAPGAGATAGGMAEFFTSTSSTGTGAVSGRVTDISTGTGIAGATVKSSSGSTTADSNGNYSLAGIAAGTAAITASASGYFAESASASVTAGATSTMNLQLPTGGILAGTVTGSNGAALSNATVTVSGGKVSTTKTVITNSAGAYNTSWIPVGNYAVSVSASGYSTASNSATLSTGATTTLNFTMGGATTAGAISGRVVDITSGAGISGASVSNGSVSTNSDGNGYFKFSNLAAATYRLTASASGYFAESTTVTVTSGATAGATLTLPTGGILAGTVTGSNGAALANASVTVSGGAVSTTKTLTTNSSGVYNTSWVPVGSYSVNVSANGYASQTRSTTVNTGATTTLNIAMSGATGYSTITGRVTDISNGGSVSGAKVTCGSLSTTADSSGYYTLANVPAGTNSVTAGASGYFSRTLAVSTTAGTTSTLNLQLATGGKVQGTVTNSSGAAIAGASAKISGGSVATTVNVSATSSGVYNSNWVPVGTYTVTVSASGYTTQSKTVNVTTGNTATLNFTMP